MKTKWSMLAGGVVLLLLAYLFFNVLSFDSCDKNPTSSDVALAKFGKYRNPYKLKVEENRGIFSVRKESYSWQSRIVVPELLDSDSDFVVLATRNVDWDAGWRIILPTYSQIHLLNTSDLREVESFRISGIVRDARLVPGKIVLRFADASLAVIQTTTQPTSATE